MKDKLERCKRLIIYTLKLRKNDSIYYQEFLEIYKKSQEILGQEGIFLNEKDFAEQILELTLLSYKAIKYAKGSAKILKNYQVDSQEIENIRKKLICQERLHKGQQLTYNKIRQFFENEQYFLPLEEKEYFEKMLDITNFRLRNIKSKPNKAKTSILENEEVSDEEIRSFKEKLLKEEKLHSGDTLTYEQCRNLFEKHHIRISEIDFMDKILDITNKAYTEIRYNPQKRVRILKKTTLNKELILKIRRYIIWKEKLYKKQEKIYDEIKAIFDKYYTVLSEIEFTEKILDITEASLRTVKSNGNKAVIDLEEFEKIYEKFGKQGTRRTFAEVIGVDIRNFTKRLKTTNFKQKNKKSKR